MNTRIFAIVTALLALVAGSAKADGLKVSELTLNAGTQGTMEVTLEQDAQKYAGLQFDLKLPTGLSLVGDQLVKEQTGDMTCSKRVQNDGTVRFVVYSPTLSTAKAGGVLQLHLKADKNARKDSRQLSLKNIILTDAEGTITRPDDASVMVTFAAPIKVTAKSVSREYGEENGQLTYEVSGSGIAGTPVVACEATATSPVGKYAIVVDKGSIEADTVTLVNGTLTVTKAPLTITAKSLTRKQGEENPTLEAVYEGFKNGETEEVLTTKPTLRTTAKPSSALGDYEITLTGATATNYSITYQKGTLTVTEADPVTVTAKSYSRMYGETIPKLEYDVTGAALEGEPTITCTATAKSPVGTYPITIKKGGVKNYNDTYVDGVLTILPAPLTITAKSYTRKQGEESPKFEVSYEGWKNSETATVLTKQPTVTCEATAASEPGEYVITVGGAEAGNYEISYVAGKLTVTEADAVVVTAKSYSRVYGESNPAFGYEVSGAQLDGEPLIECEATEESPVGTYPITIKKGTVKNYNDTYVDGVLTITPAKLTVTAGSYTKKQYDPMPEFAVSYEGFANDETETVLTKLPTVSCEAGEDSKAGEYAITVSGAEAQNYEISYVPGKLTVTVPDAIGDATQTGRYIVRIYTVGGKPLKELQRGVNIVVMSDGTRRKVFK